MGGFASALSIPGAGGVIGGVGNEIANIGNAASGIIPGQSQVPAIPNPMSIATPKSIPSIGSTAAQVTPGPNMPAPASTSGSPVMTSPLPSMPVTPTGAYPAGSPPTMAGGAPVGTAVPINGGDYNSVYGVDTGTAITNLLNQEGSGADSTAQEIIQANAPNVAKGSADLNTSLAAAGISPSSSVSAITNADYMGAVQQQDLSTLAQTQLSEQQMQQQLLESLLPSQQQRQTDSSGWSIFGDVMQGVGDVATLGIASLF